ncbi:ribosome maturation protein, partial [Dimargaris cristalligena]
ATKIVYKDTHKGSEEFFVFAEPDMIKKWRKDKSIPLAQVLETFNVYTVDTGGNTGLASTPSKGTLESTFQTSNVDDICRFILERGEIKG